MAWRFQASKFKNTTPKIPKKEDTIFDLPIGNLSCTNNGIHTSASWIAFHIEGEGGKLGAVPIGTHGRRLRNDISIVCAHAELVSDFGFMPYDEDVLVTCSRDERVKVWRLSRDRGPTTECEIDVGSGRMLESLRAHSTAANILAVGSIGSACVVDVNTQNICLELHGIVDKCQSMDWSEDGRLLAASGDKGRQVLVFDPRSGSSPVHVLDGHGGMGREARVLFCGDRLLSTGFTNKRVQEVRLYDTGKWGAPMHCQEFVSTTGVLIPHFDPDTRLVFLSGKGTNKMFLMELQDRQPYMSSVYELTLPEQTLGAAVGSKRRVAVMDGEVDVYYQLTKSSVLPIPCIVPRRSYRDFHADLFPETRSGEAGCTSAEWLAGSNTVPPKVSLAPAGKTSPPPQEPTPPSRTRAQTHVEQSTSQPLPVKRRSQPEAVEEPNATKGGVAVKELDYGVDGKENGLNVHVSNYTPKFQTAAVPPSLLVKTNDAGVGHPAKHSTSPQVSPLPSYAHPSIGSTGHGHSHAQPAAAATTSSTTTTATVTFASTPSSAMSPPTVSSTTTPTANGPSLLETTNTATSAGVKLRATPSFGGGERTRPLSTRVRPKSCVVGQITSKFRHVEALAGIKANNAVFSNLRNVNTRLPPECNGCCTSGKFVAVPLSGPAGVVGIYDVDAPGKLPDGVMDGVFNKAQVTDMQWNPFDDEHLAVGTDVGVVNLWRVTRDDDGARNESEPEAIVKIGGEKIVALRWHPLAAGLMAIALSNNTIELWDMHRQIRRHVINAHQGTVLAMAWSADGRRLASVAKDGMLMVHEPRADANGVLSRKVLESTRAARVLFACDDRIVLVIGMTKSSGRQVQMYDATMADLRPIYTQQIDSATQPLVPHYDYDTNVLFLSGKGDRYVHMYEVIYDSPYLLPLTPYMAPTGHQTIAFHNKKRCNVMAVEFQVGWRLTEKSLEQLIFRVPRVKKDVFQSDLFPDALVTWEPVMTADDWLAGSDAGPAFCSLQPPGVSGVSSQAPVTPLRPTTRQHENIAAAPRHVDDASTKTLISHSMLAQTPKSMGVAPDRKEEPVCCSKGTEVSVVVTESGSEGDRRSAAVVDGDDDDDDDDDDGDEDGLEFHDADVAASWSSRIGVDKHLEQDTMEGVAEEEWTE